ncbi:DNA integration/recombination/invertion protein [Moritella viscosa]|uniref:DNA integration/recombination/invertion protein n=1 Tax=Moritella viscosa TaxID=80854 RepID=A0ABY1HHJ6_9GAMM|nr:DNA integration/recombination/invertion protein [Moritella viscosa]
MMNGGNILVLQRILGHASIVDTMKLWTRPLRRDSIYLSFI